MQNREQVLEVRPNGHDQADSLVSERELTLLPPSDDQLVRRAQAGEKEAVGQLYDRYHESIFRFILIRVGQQPLAEDLTGEVFIRMLDSLPRYRSMGIPFHAWLYRIARNLLTDHYRRQQKLDIAPLDELEPDSPDHADPASTIEHTLTLERVQQALNRLERIEADVIVLRFLAGLSLGEAAQALEKTVGAVKALQHRGLVRLRAALMEESR